MDVNYIVTVNGGNKLTKTIYNSKAKIGFEALNNIPENYNPYFIDYPFTKSCSFNKYLSIVKKYNPKLVVCPDIENRNNLSKRLKQAKKLLNYSEDVIVITKVTNLHPSSIKDKYIVGLPNQEDFGSNRIHNIKDFQDCKRVHILGGSPNSYNKLSKLNINSADSTSILKASQFGDVWTKDKWVERSDLNYYERINLSINNIFNFFNQDNLK